MKEIWEQAILPCNLPLTILLGLVILFWLFTLIGAFSVDSIEADLDTDGDGMIDHIGDISAAMLRMVNAGSVPVTVVLSLLILMMWLVSITLNYYFNPTQNVLFCVLFFIAAFIGGVIATKLITQPLVPFMRKLKEAENAAPVIGEEGIVRSISIDSTYGQVEVPRPDGAPALLNARLGHDAAAVPRGTPVIVVSLDESTGVYLVRPLPNSPFID